MPHQTRSRFGLREFVIISLWLLSSCPWSVAQDRSAKEDHESWQVIHIGNQRVGYQFGRERIELRDKTKVIISISESHFSLKRFGKN